MLRELNPEKRKTTNHTNNTNKEIKKNKQENLSDPTVNNSSFFSSFV